MILKKGAIKQYVIYKCMLEGNYIIVIAKPFLYIIAPNLSSAQVDIKARLVYFICNKWGAHVCCLVSNY